MGVDRSVRCREVEAAYLVFFLRLNVRRQVARPAQASYYVSQLLLFIEIFSCVHHEGHLRPNGNHHGCNDSDPGDREAQECAGNVDDDCIEVRGPE